MATQSTDPPSGDVVSMSTTNNATADAQNTSVLEDHPRGDEIRRQVEFYFSDENLPTDLHLLRCCGGRENLPVSINLICGFKKMRCFKPKRLVLTALRKSTFLEISVDGKTVKRKIPLQGRCVTDPDFHDNDDIAFDPRVKKPAVFPVPLISQKKVENPNGLSKNMLKPTGFERSFIEPPQTPQEVLEEEALYDPDKSFVERIEIAIQRFKQKKRMHTMYAQVFDKLMRFGGVESGPRMYQGTSPQDLKNMGAEEIARALATHLVPNSRSDEKQWVVDFTGVAKAFLGSWYPAHYGMAPNVIKNVCQVLRSFYNYLLYHRVCPEYNADLEAARMLCDTAEEELPKVSGAGLALPGDFNRSASTLFGGSHAGVYTGDKAWAQGLEKEDDGQSTFGIRDEEAKIMFATGVAIMGSDEQFKKVQENSLKVLNRQQTGLEVIAIASPHQLTKSAYEEQNQTLQHKLGPLEPLGKLVCKTWSAENSDGWDLPQHGIKYPNGNAYNSNNDRVYEFWIEAGVLENCFTGMKLDATLIELDDGLMILDDVNEAMCSFFTWLPNELWMERKPKEVRWLKKSHGLDGDEEFEEDGVEVEKTAKAADDDEFDDE
ncbi:hypothetical protein ACN47E_009319 [Coniothyrium glycines]